MKYKITKEDNFWRGMNGVKLKTVGITSTIPYHLLSLVVNILLKNIIKNLKKSPKILAKNLSLNKRFVS